MGYIFESEIDQIIHTVRGQTIGENESITLRDLLVSPIHPALKAYFRAEVADILERERSGEVRSKRFPYSHPEVVSLQHQMDLLLVHHYEFTNEEIERSIDEAVHFQFNYLCRPQFTLVGYIVGDRRRVPVSEIFRKLVRCVEYEYFPDLIKRYCDDRGLAEMTYEEFRDLLSRIDTEVVSRHDAEELAAMTRGLISFVDFGRATPHDDQNQPTLPTNAAIVFYEDKGLTDVTTRLEEERDEHGKELITLSELKDVLREVWSDTLRTEDRPAPPEPLRPDVPVSAQAEPAGHSGADEPAAQAGEEKTSLEEAVSASDTSGETSVVQPASSLPDVHELFTKRDVKRFVKSIFGKDDKAFREVLDRVNELVEWDDTSHFLDEVFVSQDVDPFSKEAVEFTDKVYARYFPG